MKKFTLYSNLLFLLCMTNSILFSEGQIKKLNLLPVPVTVIQTGDRFRLTENFTIAVKGETGVRVFKGATRALRRLAGRTGLFFPQDYITENSREETADFIISTKRSGKLALYENESYQLTVVKNKIELFAETDIGALRGLETFLQLLSVDEEGYYFPTVQIEDAPRFPWRGLLIDTSRHFMPVAVIKRNLDGLAAVKMNVLHWHLVDDQGFRVECKTFPKLHEMGSDGFYYTQAQIKDIIAYANDRGIRILPEFDVPAHTTSWLVGHPELASAPGPYRIAREWGVLDPTMDPTRKGIYKFLDKFFAEMAALFPDEYVHIGGDENNGKHWSANEKIQSYMQKNEIPDNHTLQSHFNRRILKIITKHGKKMVGWDEIFHPDLPENIVIQSWQGQQSLVESARKGYHGILSNGYYIDLIQPASYHYLIDPIPENSPLSEQERKNILGGEATMWGELVSPETIDSRIWPRTAAIAERLWSRQEVRDVEDMYSRLEVISFQLEELGLTHQKNYEMMLRRLTHNTEITALKNLVDVIEPVKIYQRQNQGIKYTSYSPLTRVVDAARPESMTARRFRTLVDTLLLNKTNAAETEIKTWLTLWKNNHAVLIKTIKISPILKEIETLSEDLMAISEIGLTAMEYLTTGKSDANDWVENSLQTLKTAKQPRAQVELMVVSAIAKLVREAGSK